MRNEITTEVRDQGRAGGVDGDDGDISGEEEAEVGAGVLPGLQTDCEPHPVCPRLLCPALLQPRALCQPGHLSVRAGLRGAGLLQV